MKKIIFTIAVIAALISMAACSAAPKGNTGENQSIPNESVSENTRKILLSKAQDLK